MNRRNGRRRNGLLMQLGTTLRANIGVKVKEAYYWWSTGGLSVQKPWLMRREEWIRLLPASKVAEWFVNWAEASEEPSDVTNLKLQKLLYYAQGHHLGLSGTPMFSEPIQAWSHGPVVPAVYRTYKQFENGPVKSVDPNFTWAAFTDEDMEFLSTVWNTYGRYSAWQLRNMTHSERPWIQHFSPDVRHIEIPKDTLREHFIQLHA